MYQNVIFSLNVAAYTDVSNKMSDILRAQDDFGNIPLMMDALDGENIIAAWDNEMESWVVYF